jgi:hypothetical protein
VDFCNSEIVAFDAHLSQIPIFSSARGRRAAVAGAD